MVGRSRGPTEHGQQAGLGIGLGRDGGPLGDRTGRAIRVLLDDELVDGEIDQLGVELGVSADRGGQVPRITTWSKINWVR
jgi:hypothetical protein